MALPAVNYTHANENWRQRLVKEKAAAQEFVGTYDYLIWKDSPTHLNRPSASCKVKYYKSLGGDWTVKDKRIGLREQGRANELTADEEAAMTEAPETSKNAMHTCLLTHTVKMRDVRNGNPLYRTTASVYGSRRPLEMFGLSEHAIKATRSKEPVGNGTKIYIK